MNMQKIKASMLTSFTETNNFINNSSGFSFIKLDYLCGETNGQQAQRPVKKVQLYGLRCPPQMSLYHLH